MIKTLVLNLDRSSDRLQAMALQFKTLGIPFERVSGVDGKLMPEEEFEKFCKKTGRVRNKWGRGQMGCFLSHFHAWEIAANSPDPYTAIFEDDMHLSSKLINFLSTDSWIPRQCEIIRLETSTNRVWLDSEMLVDREDRVLQKVKSTTWCAGGYIISRDAAKRLINLPPSTYDSVDSFLFCFELKGVAQSLHISQVYPALCVQDKFNHADVKDIRFLSNIDDVDPSLTWLGRLRFSNKSPLTFLAKTIRGYKKIPYVA